MKRERGLPLVDVLWDGEQFVYVFFDEEGYAHRFGLNVHAHEFLKKRQTVAEAEAYEFSSQPLTLEVVSVRDSETDPLVPPAPADTARKSM